MGLKSCGDWTAAARENGEARRLYESWLGGFFSGINLNISTTIGNLNEGTDFLGMVGWMDNYCAAKPLDSVDTAAIDLAVELLKRNAPAK